LKITGNVANVTLPVNYRLITSLFISKLLTTNWLMLHINDD